VNLPAKLKWKLEEYFSSYVIDGKYLIRFSGILVDYFNGCFYSIIFFTFKVQIKNIIREIQFGFT